jgi:hypothetical protein
MFVSVGREWNWSLGFSNSSWKLQVGSTFPVELSFDGRTPYAGTATAIADDLVELPMAPSSQLVTDFRAGKLMSVLASGNRYGFALTATSRVMAALAACVTEENAYEQGGNLPDLEAAVIFSAKPHSMEASTPPSSPPMAPLQAPAPVVGALDRTLVATQIATNLLLQGGFRNAHLLSASETPDYLKGSGVAWTSDVSTGAVQIIDAPAGQTGQEVASKLIASDAAVCKGDFASGRSSDLVDNTVVTKAFVGCKQSDGMKSVRYLIYQGGSAHFVVFDTVSSSASAEPSVPPANESRVETAALKAVTYQTWQ